LNLSSDLLVSKFAAFKFSLYRYTAAKEEAARQAERAATANRKVQRPREELEAAGDSLYRQGLEQQARRQTAHEATPPHIRAGMSPRGMGGEEAVKPRGMTNVSRVLMSNAQVRLWHFSSHYFAVKTPVDHRQCGSRN
jgi:hypothetical protein